VVHAAVNERCSLADDDLRIVGREDSGEVTLFDGLEQTAGCVNIFLRHTFCSPIESKLCYLSADHEATQSEKKASCLSLLSLS
jgi:hypothetical protein